MTSALLDAVRYAFQGFSQAVAPVVVTALWQGAILASGLAVCLRLAPRVSPAHRFAIWAAGFAVVVLLPVLPILIAAFGAAGTFPLGGVPRPSGPLLRLDLRWSLVIGALWIAASIARAVDLGIHSLRLRRLWKTARVVSAFHQQCGCPVVPRPPRRRDQGKRNLNLGRPTVEVCTTTELDRPSVIGFFAPRILIPGWLYARLTPEELEQVVLHESEHLRRHDDWTNLLQKICLVVFPLNPSLAWMERQLCQEREMACDDGVVRATQAPRAYAACLASLAERGLERRAEALSLGAWQRRPELVERVHRILRRTPGLSPMAATALVSALGCGLVFGSIEFARCPQLVAFVPTARVVAQSDAAAGLGDARFTNASYEMDGRSAAGFRAVDAVARVPVAKVSSDVANKRNRESLRQAQGEKNNRRSFGSLRYVPVAQDDSIAGVVKTASVGNDDPIGQAKPTQQWIVFTAWKQVESGDADSARQDSKLETGLSQDYDSAPTADLAAKDGKIQNGAAVGGSAHSFHVLQLILRIYTAGSDSSSTVGQPSTTGQPSMTDQPAALVPLRDGWFVFQL